MYWNFDLKREYPKASNPAIPFYDVFKKDINIPVHHIGASPMYDNDCTIESYLKRTPCVVKNSLVEQWIGLSNSVKGTDLKLTAYNTLCMDKGCYVLFVIVFDIFVNR